jgi:Tol biopolymer transport system component
MKQLSVLSLFLLVLGFSRVEAQYFGRNKPRYQKLDFKVAETEHFTMYEYLNNPDKLRELATATELWYNMHQAVLRDTFRQKNPLIIYNDHAGFQQTNVIQGEVSVGTGGVTEGLRNRVIYPVAMTNQQTHHVLGHELVHAFQYHMVLGGDSTNMQSLSNLPLWMVEGLAEYLSIGRIDAHTALWMRDAVVSGDVPRIKDLDDFRYFPYRWGQAFWAYVAGIYGDVVIRDLFMNTAKYGMEISVPLTLNTSVDSLSEAWRSTLRNHYGQWVTVGKDLRKKGKDKDKDADKGKDYTGLLGERERLPGKKLLSEENAGAMNIAAVLSPNGKYVVFLSEINLFTTDLFLADAKTGKIIKKIASSAQDGHIDQFNFIESAGAWSPDDKRFAFEVYEKGQNVLVIKDVFKGKTLEKISIPGVPAFSNPAWSPDGKNIVVSGLVNGQTDLYAYNLKSKKVRRLTNDKYSEILPAWSGDGKNLAFSTDYYSMERGRSNGAWVMNLAVMDFESGETEHIDVFPGADNLNPQYDKQGNLLFLSNRDGFRNLYRYDMTQKKVYQLSKMATGITGITPYAPALSVAEDRDRLLYTYYSKGRYTIYEAKSQDFEAEEVSATAVDMLPATLPPFKPGQRDVVNTNLRLLDANTKVAALSTTLTSAAYKPKFSLEYLGGSTGLGGGVATGNNSFGNAVGLAGGVDMLFGDILGNNQLYAGAALSGEITDAAGQASYINQKGRINWGVNISHIPYRSGSYLQDPDFAPGREITQDGREYIGFKDELYIERFFQERLGLFTFYPLSTTKRIEVGAAYELYHSRIDQYSIYYDSGGFQFGQERQKIQGGGGNLNFGNINAALVGDNSFFGLTAPLQGWRYRIGAEYFIGDFNFPTLLLDGRRYFRVKPFTFAVRGLGYGRFGGNSDQVFPFFAAQPFFVRGYTQRVLNANPSLVEQMQGSKLAVANAEIRIPFTGPRKLALIPNNFLLTDLNFFFDAGLGLYNKSDWNPVDLDPLDGRDPVKHRPLMSIGASLRVNLFGAIVVEPYYALPLAAAKENRSWVFGVNLIPGW